MAGQGVAPAGLPVDGDCFGALSRGNDPRGRRDDGPGKSAGGIGQRVIRVALQRAHGPGTFGDG